MEFSPILELYCSGSGLKLIYFLECHFQQCRCDRRWTDVTVLTAEWSRSTRDVYYHVTCPRVTHFHCPNVETNYSTNSAKQFQLSYFDSSRAVPVPTSKPFHQFRKTVPTLKFPTSTVAESFHRPNVETIPLIQQNSFNFPTLTVAEAFLSQRRNHPLIQQNSPNFIVSYFESSRAVPTPQSRNYSTNSAKQFQL
ncbi:hypothetical protein J6590_033247 [Homalodisca vitripennis]|nr:hypothetical protein J6590_033247 [Homalodisca vitripennis]